MAGASSGIIPFPDVTAKDIISHMRVWVTDSETGRLVWRNSKLISLTAKLMWAVWEAIRRLVKVRYNAGPVTFYIIRIGSDTIVANAYDVLPQLDGVDACEAAKFARSSSESFALLRIPARCIEDQMTFTLRVGLHWFCDKRLTSAGAPQLVARILLFD